MKTTFHSLLALFLLLGLSACGPAGSDDSDDNASSCCDIDANESCCDVEDENATAPETSDGNASDEEAADANGTDGNETSGGPSPPGQVDAGETATRAEG